MPDANRYQGSGRFGRYMRRPITIATSVPMTNRRRRMFCASCDGSKKNEPVARTPSTRYTRHTRTRQWSVPVSLFDWRIDLSFWLLTTLKAA
jgi:hypothetical protein